MNRRTSPRPLSRPRPQPQPDPLRHSPPHAERLVRARTSARQWRHRTLGFVVLSAAVVVAAAGIAAGEDRPRPTLGIGARPATTTTPTREGGSAGGPAARDEPTPLDELPDLLIGDQALRGRIDLSSMVRDGDGYEVRVEGGRRARLTIDPAVQEQAQKLLARSRAPMAAIVVMRPDGRILALAGRKHGPPPAVSA